MRILGFILIVTLGCVNLVGLLKYLYSAVSNMQEIWKTLQRRLPASKVAGGIVNPKIFRNPAFSVFVTSVLVAFLGLYTCQCLGLSAYVNIRADVNSAVLTYINVSSNAAGIDPNFSFYLVSIANASSGLGRIVSGILADRFGTQFHFLSLSLTSTAH